MKSTLVKNARRKRRRMSVRKRVRSAGPTVRLSVYRSTKHIYAQVVDDTKGLTLCAVGSSAKKFASELSGKTKTERAAIIGKEIARLAKEKGVEEVVFDRGHCRFHGRVKALADAAREEGLKF